MTNTFFSFSNIWQFPSKTADYAPLQIFTFCTSDWRAFVG